jgi:hypothetical protein
METKPEERKSNAGRNPYDAILKFKIVVLRATNSLMSRPVPDSTCAFSIWNSRTPCRMPPRSGEALAQAALIDKLFARFGQHLDAESYIGLRVASQAPKRYPIGGAPGPRALHLFAQIVRSS